MRPVLLAEDEETDIMLIRLAFQEAQITNPLDVVHDGREAVSYLLKRYGRGLESLPCLGILDVNMPKMSGLEVLEWLRSEPQLGQAIPVVMLSSSSLEVDVRTSLDLGAREYLTKPPSLQDLVSLFLGLKQRWLETR